MKERQGIGKVVVLSDNEKALAGIREQLFRELGRRLHTFKSGQEAAAFVRGNDVDLVICDNRMPDLQGVSLLQCARRFRPGAHRVMLGGGGGSDEAMRGIHDIGAFQYI